MQKFAEDERLEQMTQNKRRAKEAEHKREVEELWLERLNIYREQREQELLEIEMQRLEDERIRAIIESEKARLLAEHMAILQQHNPKAFAKY